MSRRLVQRIFRKIFRLPVTCFSNFLDRFSTPIWLKIHGLEWGPGCRFAGLPSINIVPGARIILGKKVSILSRFNSNPRGVPNPSILSAMKPGAVIQIGDNSGMSGVSIISRERVTIGNWVQMGPGVTISDNDAHPLDPMLRRQRPTPDHRSAPVVIDDDVFIGSQALILKGVTIGKGAIVGAGAIVTKSVKPLEIVGGNPARVIGLVPLTNPSEYLNR